MPIEKAPLSYMTSANPIHYEAACRQRDADHQWYLQQFVKWLKEKGVTVASASVGGMQAHYMNIEDLKKEAGLSEREED